MGGICVFRAQGLRAPRPFFFRLLSALPVSWLGNLTLNSFAPSNPCSLEKKSRQVQSNTTEVSRVCVIVGQSLGLTNQPLNVFTITFLIVKNSMDHTSGFGMDRVFLDLSKIRLEMAGIGNEGWCLSAAVCHLGCSPLLPHFGPSGIPTFGRGVASSSHCQRMGPNELQARSRPTADPSKVNSS